MLYSHAFSRMDVNVIALICEDSYDPDQWEKYENHAKSVKRFDSDDLKFIIDVKE